MNYRKTKTIHKQGTINRSGLLSSLLLFFLLVSCGGQHATHTGGSHHNQPKNKKEASTQGLKENFLEWLGAWGPCKDACFLSQLREDAKNSGRKTKRVAGVESYVLPNNCLNDANKSYLEGLVKQDVVAGSEEGRKKWRMLLRRNKKQNVGQFREGLYGVLKEVVDIELNSSGRSLKGSTGLYVIDQYMKFQQSVEWILNNTPDKEAISLRLDERFKELELGIDKVRPGTKGMTLVIPVEEASDDINKLVYFVDRSEEGNSKKTERKKNYTLSKDEEVKINKINEDIKAQIAKLIEELK